MNKSIEWYCDEEEFAPATDEDIAKVEHYFNIRFPEDFRREIKYSHGCNPSLDCIKVKNHEEVVDYLASFSPNDRFYIIKQYERQKDRLVEGIYPIADDPFGNAFCYDYRKDPDNPSIVFWNHEYAYENPEEALTYVCGSFTEFLSMLYEIDEDDI